MVFQQGVELPQGQRLHDRVNANISKSSGHLEDQSLDVDRNFGLVSLVAFSTTLIASWESIARAPTSGAQYHWVSQLAPARYAVAFSWAAGWISIFARVTVSASAAFVASEMVQGLIILNAEDYEPLRWHATLIYWMILLVAVLVNILGTTIFPHIETAAFFFHICFFFVLLVPLVYLSPRSTARFVFTDFENSSGWKSDGVSWCLGLLTSAWSFVGIDGTSHMSEEVKNSAVVVPRSMVVGMVISGAFTMAFSVAMLFGIGDIMLALTSPTKFPIIQIFLAATGSKGATTAMTCTLISTLVFSTFGLLACASRLAWAFARDKGLPFSNYFARVSKHYMIPVRAIILVTVIACLLGLVNIGSAIAFHALTSLALVAHYTSYLLPITLLVLRRFGKTEIPWGPWTLGRWGLPINLFAMAYSFLLIVFMVLPQYQPVSVANMNYASPIFGVAMLVSIILWFVYGKKAYWGPVREVIENLHIKQ
ncbi:MAG: hypothetical protein Q9208_002702 [Pyrenodesmia sp. 3 TL-2023]